MNVLVVDDSAFVRKIISDMLNSDPELTVVGSARDGLEALKQIEKLHPDVITLDVTMPRMDGLTALKHIMNEQPLPVIIVSSFTREGAETTLKALELGAFDYVLKPSGAVFLDMHRIREDLIGKIKASKQARFLKRSLPVAQSLKQTTELSEKVILIGASTGGPPAIEHILLSLPENIPPTLIVQHMPPSFTKFFAERLSIICKFKVKEAEENDPITRNRALIAPGGYHMTVETDEKVHLNQNPPLHGVRPAVDCMMETAANVYSSKTLGVLLTGMGQDGAQGMKAIKKAGGFTIAQDEKTSTIFGMPKAAIELNCIDKVLPLPEIAQEIMHMTQKQNPHDKQKQHPASTCPL